MKPFQPDASGPLHGIIVLDLSRLVAGNMLSLQLADFGAEVVKIEDPKKGDPLRDWRINGQSFFWKAYARNKKSLTLDLKNERARDILLTLVAKAHVLIENYRPGTLERMGLEPSVLHQHNRKLIIVRISGWGQTGPYAKKPGFGTLVEGMSGFAAKTGFADREPVLPPTALADMIAGLYGMSATMIALREIETHDGNGQIIDLSLLEAMHSVVGADSGAFAATGFIPKRQGSRSNTASPRNVFQSRDGRWISVSGSMQSMAERLYVSIGRSDMNTDPRFATNSARLVNNEEAERPLREFIAARDFAECISIFEAAEVTCAPVYDIDQFVSDAHVKQREVVIEMADEDVGQVTMHNIMPRMSLTPGAMRLPAPRLGEHTAEILARAGVSNDDIAQLRFAKDCLMSLPRADLPAWRSLMFVPVIREKFVASAHTRGADAYILDLEDSVPEAEKDRARTLIHSAAKEVSKAGADVLVRINRPWHQAFRDIEAAVGEGVMALMCPKTESPEHVSVIAEMLEAVEAQRGLPIGHTKIVPLVETADAFFRLREIAKASPRLVGLSLGAEDFALALAMEPIGETLQMAKQHMIIAARAAGILPLGFMGTVADFADMAAFRETIQRSRKFGFAAGTCVHPSQVAILNEDGWSENDIDRARRLISAYDDAIAKGLGAVTFEGKMIDVPVVERAKAVLAVAAKLEARRLKT